MIDLLNAGLDKRIIKIRMSKEAKRWDEMVNRVADYIKDEYENRKKLLAKRRSSLLNEMKKQNTL